MGTLEAINTFPLTGGRAIHLERTQVGPAGLDGDRRYILYDVAALRRISAAQLPRLLRITPEVGTDSTLHLNGLDGNPTLTVPAQSFSRPIDINEFEDKTPVLACDDAHAVNSLTAFAQSPTPLGLAKKTKAWTQGGLTSPRRRKNAPLHIVNAATVRHFQSPEQNISFNPDRFRANFVIDGFEPLAEVRWPGRMLKIGKLLVLVTGLTERCNVPSFNPATGENLKDVGTLYKNFPRIPAGGKKPCLGVYGVPLLPHGNREQVAVSDDVILVASAGRQQAPDLNRLWDTEE